MSLETWWSHVQQDTRDWLLAHNGEALSPAVVQDVERVAGPLPAQAWWLDRTEPDGLHLSDAAVDWVEEVANGEVPRPPSSAS
ncbi:hypothetical protein [Kineococcus sp. SYSU DK001]|uniref:hypothetical protein n=1 Tax=Kineococcus sp. SYSU DK001 TaxID=3383122 RepID=UPI003D7C6FB3